MMVKFSVVLSKLSLVFLSIALVAGCQHFRSESEYEKLAKLERQVMVHYADLAHAIYSDAFKEAEKLRHAATMLVLSPTDNNLQYAREAWREARVPYMQSEVFRFGHQIVDEWEGQVNAWPLDEGLIDYVDPNTYEFAMGNPGAQANIVANRILRAGSQAINASTITTELIASLNELGGSEANVASGYHAIEFLLWGQDLHGSDYGAGERPYTDFSNNAQCTNGNCDRRGAYLIAATQLLVDDLAFMSEQWSTNGPYRQEFLALPHQVALEKMLFGMGSLSLGELAGERMKVALEANSVEDEHDCFSDNTHYSHYYNALGVQNIYLGQYKQSMGPIIAGPSLSDLIRRKNKTLDQSIHTALDTTMQAMQNIVSAAEDPDAPMPFDMMIAEGNQKGESLVYAAINELRTQTQLFDQAKPLLKNTLPKP